MQYIAIGVLFIATGFGTLSSKVGQIAKYLKWVEIIGGIFLVVLGYLLLTNNFSLLISYGYRLFDFINYDALLDYL